MILLALVSGLPRIYIFGDVHSAQLIDKWRKKTGDWIVLAANA